MPHEFKNFYIRQFMVFALQNTAIDDRISYFFFILIITVPFKKVCLPEIIHIPLHLDTP